MPSWTSGRPAHNTWSLMTAAKSSGTSSSAPSRDSRREPVQRRRGLRRHFRRHLERLVRHAQQLTPSACHDRLHTSTYTHARPPPTPTLTPAAAAATAASGEHRGSSKGPSDGHHFRLGIDVDKTLASPVGPAHVAPSPSAGVLSGSEYRGLPAASAACSRTLERLPGIRTPRRVQPGALSVRARRRRPPAGAAGPCGVFRRAQPPIRLRLVRPVQLDDDGEDHSRHSGPAHPDVDILLRLFESGRLGAFSEWCGRRAATRRRCSRRCTRRHCRCSDG